MMELYRKPIRALRAMLDAGEISSRELTDYYFARIDAIENKIHSFITIDREYAYKQAELADKRIHTGSVRTWTGIPIALKDNICLEGMPATCGSRMLADFRPPYSATIAGKLAAQGAVILGKTNMDEFGMGSTTGTSYFGATCNPYGLDRIPGGSSGGSAAAVAAGLAAVALGSDTGGSIRQPAAFCGVTGLKPSYGVVSRYGLIAYASSLDQIGPLARSAEDCGIMLDAISDYDPHDQSMLPPNCFGYTAKIGSSLKGLRIGVPKEFYKGLDPAVRKAMENALEVYRSLGAETVEVSLPSLEYAVAAYYLIACAEASSNLSRYDGIRFGYRSEKGETFAENIAHTRAEGFGAEVKRRILLGTYALSAGYYDDYYGRACGVREKIRAEFAEIFTKCDCIVTPTAATAAPPAAGAQDDPVKLYEADLFTVPASLAGLPAISTPCGYDALGMPIGLSVTGRPFDEETIIGVCAAFEEQFAASRKEAAICSTSL